MTTPIDKHAHILREIYGCELSIIQVQNILAFFWLYLVITDKAFRLQNSSGNISHKEVMDIYSSLHLQLHDARLSAITATVLGRVSSERHGATEFKYKQMAHEITGYSHELLDKAIAELFSNNPPRAKEHPDA